MKILKNIGLLKSCFLLKKKIKNRDRCRIEAGVMVGPPMYVANLSSIPNTIYDSGNPLGVSPEHSQVWLKMERERGRGREKERKMREGVSVS